MNEHVILLSGIGSIRGGDTVRKHCKVVKGSCDAQSVAEDLVRESMWFECEPLPDDEYEFTVKGEEGYRLDNIIRFNGDGLLRLEDNGFVEADI